MKKLKKFLSWILPPALTFAISWFLFSYIFVIAWVPTESMSPTIEPQSMVIGWRLADEIKTGDVVIFNILDSQGREIQYIKRVAGKENETFEIQSGQIYINDAPIEYDYRHATTNGDNYGPVLIPDNCYFMLGDNQDHSYDSRKWDDPFVEQEDVIAKALFVFHNGKFNFFF